MEDTIEVKLPEIKQVNTTLVQRAQELARSIVDRPSLETAVSHGIEIDRRLKWWSEWIEPLVSTTYKAWKTMTERREEVAAPLRQAKVSLSSAIGHYKFQEDQKRREAEAKLRAEQQKSIDDAKINTATTLESAGLKEEAAAVLDAPTFVPPVILPKTTETEGTHTRTNWKFSILDENKIPRDYMTPDLKKIGMVVRSMKEKSREMIPGILVQEEKMEVFKS
jgi:hypothetical protein